MKTAIERDALRRYIDGEILTSAEVIEQLGFTRQYLNQLIREGKVSPIRQGIGVYLKEDIIAFKEMRESKKAGG